MIMSSIVQDTIRDNGRETDSIITEEIFSLSELFPENATQEVGNNYDENPLSFYKATSDPDTLYQHQAIKADNRKAFLLAIMKEVTDKINNGDF